MRLVGALIAVCALAACGDGGHGSPAALKLSYNGSAPFPAVAGEAIALTPRRVQKGEPIHSGSLTAVGLIAQCA